MILFFLEVAMILASLICVIWMYNKKHYKTAILNGFSLGMAIQMLIQLISTF